ncbi:MAG: methylenetetrahydrofolate reductase [NAD(P)H] [Lachnospiraceae bacterium]|nr:methylenetetrahydrofolate reductase [NAD(P)H] [Lachnospiraceae bacterium]
MKITQLLQEDKVTLSLEVFPPKKDTAMEAVSRSVQEIASLKPDFMSVTYGAGGGTSAYTVQIAKDIKAAYGVPSMAHLTCVSSTKETVREQLMRMQEAGIENVLALRGDIPTETDFPLPDQFHYAVEMVEYIKQVAPEMCIGGACYPEGHPEAVSKAQDIKNIKAKVDAGCEFLTTQMFFDNSIFYNYMYRLREAGVMVPVIAGIMPITRKNQVERSIQLSGSCVPARFKSIVDWFGDDPAKMKQAGIAYATDQIIDLIANGISHIHVYTMNDPEVAQGIMNNLSAILHA